MERTLAYADLMFAFGLARLGQASEAERLARDANGALQDTGDPVHCFLGAALWYRVDEAIAGRPHAGGLSPELASRLEDYATGRRRLDVLYKLDRFREWSRILEPDEWVNPSSKVINAILQTNVTGVHSSETSRLGDRLPDLLGADFAGAGLGDRIKIVSSGLSLGWRLADAIADQLIGLIPTLAEEALADKRLRYPMDYLLTLFEAGVRLAVRRNMVSVVGALADDFARAAKDFPAHVRPVIRAYRAVGADSKLKSFLERVQPLLAEESGSGSTDSVAISARLAVAEGLLTLGDESGGESILDAFPRWLDGLPPEPNREVGVTRLLGDYLFAAGAAPIERSGPRFRDVPGLLAPTPSRFTTGTHYSKLHLQLLEAVVLGLTSDSHASPARFPESERPTRAAVLVDLRGPLREWIVRGLAC